jgi:YVTN family beta-propeller protein
VTNTVYVANVGDNTVSVISGRTDNVTATIHVGTSPFGVATNPLTDTAYVSNDGSNTVSVISG